jgi:hypothetical protein
MVFFWRPMPPDEFVEFPLGGNVYHPANLRSIAEEFAAEPGAGVLAQFVDNGKFLWAPGR